MVALAGAAAGAYAGFSALPDNGWAMLIGALIGGGLAWRFTGPLKVIIVLAIVGAVAWSIMQSQG
jgi:type IV secretory pathway TrbF-like protein